ncbi:MAG: AraC family transcriptional regulator [Ruthenibacterium sp.]
MHETTSIHRNDSPERTHYTIDRKSFVDIKPTLLYSGLLTKAQDWKDSAHSHSFLEILLITDGSGTVVLNEKEYAVTKGDLVIYDAGVHHFEQSSTQSPMEASFIAFDTIQLKNLPLNCILPPHSGAIFKSGATMQTLSALFAIIKNEISGKDEFYVEIAKDAGRALLMYIFRILNKTQRNVELINKDNILNKILPYIDKNFLNDISLEDVASQCFVNKYYLSHLFTENFGVSVGQYIRNKKIELAKSYLVDTDLPIAMVADQCGFHDINYFGRSFKKATSLSALQYRKMQHKKHT